MTLVTADPTTSTAPTASTATPATTAKISFVGLPAVGKTTLLKLLTGRTIDGTYVPTQGFDLGRVRFGRHVIRAWDFGGQKKFVKVHLEQFVYGSDVVFVVTDSTPRNVLASRELVEFVRELAGDECRIVALANKQDLPGHMAASRVEDVLQVPVHPTVALDPSCREKVAQIIVDELTALEEAQKAEGGA
ncbi:MAG: hypothetical protein Kow0069_06030 [Promethearchaeota archaeon]